MSELAGAGCGAPCPPPPCQPVPEPCYRTSLVYYYIALAAVLLGVILLVLYCICFNQCIIAWSGLAFVFAIAMGVLAMFAGASEEAVSFRAMVAQNEMMAGGPPGPGGAPSSPAQMSQMSPRASAAAAGL